MRRHLALVPLLLVFFVLSCARPPLASRACGDLVLWRLPETLVLTESRTAEELQTHARINLIKRAAEAQCRVAAGRYPPSLEVLAAPSQAVLAAVGRCVVDSALTRDGWSNPIEYRVEARRGLLIRSAGPDSVFGTKDDVGLPAEGSRYRKSFDVSRECFGEH